MEYIIPGPGNTNLELSSEEVLDRRIVLTDLTERAFWPEFLGSKMTSHNEEIKMSILALLH